MNIVNSAAVTETMQSLDKAGGIPPSVPLATFSIPAPPSTNALFKNVPGKGRVKTSHYSDWQGIALTAIHRQNVKNVDGYCVVLLGVERGSLQADIDNTIKATLDVIVKSGVLTDDRFVTAIFPVWNPKANGLAHVRIYPCQQMTLTFYPSHNGASGAVVVHAPFENGEDDGDCPV